MSKVVSLVLASPLCGGIRDVGQVVQVVPIGGIVAVEVVRPVANTATEQAKSKRWLYYGDRFYTQTTLID